MANNAKGKVKLPPIGQIGFVVKDLDRVIEYYSTTLGIGPWRVLDLERRDVMLRDQKTSYSLKLAFANLGTVELELIQALSGRSVWSEFLDEGREGLHHLGFFVTKEEKESITAVLAEKGIGILQSGPTGKQGGSYAYLDTANIGGVILELMHRP